MQNLLLIINMKSSGAYTINFLFDINLHFVYVKDSRKEKKGNGIYVIKKISENNNHN